MKTLDEVIEYLDNQDTRFADVLYYLKMYRLDKIKLEADQKLSVESVPSETYKRLTPKEPYFNEGVSVIGYDLVDKTGNMRINKWIEWCCPTCGWYVGEQYVPRKYNQQKSNYCSHCGQAIDWGAVEPEKYALYEKKQEQIKEWEKFVELMKKNRQ